MAEEETYLTILDVAQKLGVHHRTVRRWISEGRFPVMRFGQKVVRIRLDDFNEYLATVRKTSAPVIE